jgi:uncharacterized protein (UPF0276 family)
VNNVYVSCFNHDWDPVEYISAIPVDRVVQFHLAGHSNNGTHLIDTHDNHVIDEVWQLYGLAHRLTGGASTLLEWDARIPAFPVVHQEVMKARRHMDLSLTGGFGTPEPAREAPVPPRDPSVIPHPLHHVLPQVE